MVNVNECYLAPILRTNRATFKYYKFSDADLLLAKIWFSYCTKYLFVFHNWSNNIFVELGCGVGDGDERHHDEVWIGLLCVVDGRCMTLSIFWLTVLPTVCPVLLDILTCFVLLVLLCLVWGSTVLLGLASSEIVLSGWELSQLPHLR